MALTQPQQELIASALRTKISKPCPSCGEPNKRQLMPHLAIVKMYDGGTDLTPTKNAFLNFARSQAPRVLPTSPVSAFPAGISCCTNCGFVELYNLHVLGIASELGLPDAGVPIG